MEMKAVIHLGRVTIEVTGANQVELFDAISGATEVFGEEKCCECQSTNIRFVARKKTKGKQTYIFREMHCGDCFARLAFGQNQDGDTLFPKRKLDADGRPDGENGSYGKHNGWSRYKGEPVAEEGDEGRTPQPQPERPTSGKGRR